MSDTKLLVIFILKMVLSKNKQGYGSGLSQLWESCEEKGFCRKKLAYPIRWDIKNGLID